MTTPTREKVRLPVFVKMMSKPPGCSSRNSVTLYTYGKWRMCGNSQYVESTHA